MLAATAGCQSDPGGSTQVTAAATSPDQAIATTAPASTRDDGTTASGSTAALPDGGSTALPGDGTEDAASTEPAAATATTAQVPAATETRPEILLLAGAQLDGQPFDLATTAGNDILLWFWAPW